MGSRDPKTAWIHLRVNDETANLILEASKRYRMKPSEYIRRIIVTRLNRHFTWEPEIVERRKYGTYSENIKERWFHVRINEETRQKLQNKSEKLGLYVSDYVSFAIDHRLEMYLEHVRREGKTNEFHRVSEVGSTDN